MKGTQTLTKIRLTDRTNRRDFEEHTDFRQCLLGELIPAASHDNAGRYPLLQGEYCTVRIPAVPSEPEGVSAGVRLNLVIARFSVEMGPDGLDLQLEFALDSRGAEIQAEAEMSECQPEPDKSAQIQRQAEEL